MSLTSSSSYAPRETPDTNPYVNEPELNRNAKTFEQEPLTLIDHEDPDKHWIGGSLPAAGKEEAVSSGYSSGIGASPFPARADHQHDHRTYYGFYGQTASQICPPGQTFLNGFGHAGGRNMFAPASTQVFVPPEAGNWCWSLSLFIERQGGGIFTGECNIVIFYNNGTVSRIMWRDSLANIPTNTVVHSFDDAYSIGAPSVANNAQFAIQHNDVVNFVVSIQYLHMYRISDWISA